MNNQEILDRLEAARQIIRFNYPFEYNAYGQWKNPRIGVDALRYVANGFDVRIKQPPDKWADLKKAHAEGAVIQFKDANDTEWFTVQCPHWFHDAEYRIKPEPVKVPLSPEDVPPGSVIQRKGQTDEYGNLQHWHWRFISYVTATSSVCADRKYNWQELFADYEINRSIPLTGKWDATAWEPCYKEVEQS